jgi:tRNA pseudouridine13 synthase
MTIDHGLTPPLLTADLPGIGGHIKSQAEDFEVEEVPAYAPSGEGEFLYLWVEKREMGAEFFTRQVARRLDIPLGEVGSAGLKDRHAVTRQMISVPAACEPNLATLDGDGLRVLSVSRHTNKLKPGHLRGNRFRILVRGVEADAGERLPALLDRLRALGVPNYYGPQRFGRDGETLRLGLDLLAGKEGRRVNPFLRRLALSSVQSALFNAHVARRMSDDVFRRVLPGDVMMKWPFGGMFVAEDVAAEQARFDRREIVQGGPMYGKKMFKAADAALERELHTLREANLSLAAFHGFGKLMSGTRRYGLVYIDDLAGEVEPEGVRLSFTMPAGSYATVVIRELTHSDSLEGEESE